jgi:hypothetical protein
MSLITINGINCAIAQSESEPGIVRRWGPNGPEVSVRLLTSWGSVQALAAGLLGYITVNSDGSLSRTPPYNLPWAPQLYCTSIADEKPLTPNGLSAGWFVYNESIITANFEALTWQVDGSAPGGRVDASGLPYTTTKFRVNTEVYSPPTGAFYVGPFPSSKLLAEGSLGFVRPNIEVNMLRRWIADIPLSQAIQLAGYVNESDITMGNWTFPEGCLLFAGFDSEPKNDPNGFPTNDCTFTFLGHESVTLNEIMADDGTYQLLNDSAGGTGDPPFLEVDFSPLFEL